MEATTTTPFLSTIIRYYSSSSSSYSCSNHCSSRTHCNKLLPFQKQKHPDKCLRFGVSPRSCLLGTSSAFVLDNNNHNNNNINHHKSSREKEKETLVMNTPKMDKSGRFCSPRAARELALMIIYASCLEGSDPVRLFEKRINARRESGYEFDKDSLLEYNHMSFGGPPVTTESPEEADELLFHDEKQSAIEAEVLSAPPKLVYSKLLLRFTRKLLVAVVEKWDNHVLVIDKVAPLVWKNEPAGRILELCILHLAMSEITVLGTRHQIVINEAIDLAKRFCDGAAPRIINGCLRTFMKDFSETRATQTQESKK